MPIVVRTILIVTAAVFLATEFIPGWQQPGRRWLALWFVENPYFGAWQLLTSVFMHGGLTHILFNMVGVVSFGVPLEQRWGARRFLLFYVVCGVGAALAHMATQEVRFHLAWDQLNQAGMTDAAISTFMQTPGMISVLPAETREAAVDLYRVFAAPMLGASGALYGVLVAFAALYPRVRLSLMFLPVPIEARFFIPGLVLLALFSGFTGFSIFGGGVSVAHFAHIGGALTGFVLIMLWRRRS